MGNKNIDLNHDKSEQIKYKLDKRREKTDIYVRT
jgi:hypothetical protein